MNLNHLAVFLAVAQTGSFTRAAKLLGLDKGHVSRVVAALEQSLGVVVLSRTTRAISLTPAGEQLCARIAAPLAALESAGASLVDRPTTPEGLVTLTTTPDLGRALVAPLLSAFRARFPAVRVRLLLEAKVVSLQEARADLGLRVGPMPAGSLKTRKLGQLEAGFFGSPRYLAARGIPREPSELAKHDGLWPAANRRRAFATSLAPPPPTIDCDDFGALLEVARAGGGIAVLPTFLAARDVAHGALTRVLPELSLRGAPLNLVTARERPLPPRIAALRDFLAEAVPLALSRGRA